MQGPGDHPTIARQWSPEPLSSVDYAHDVAAASEDRGSLGRGMIIGLLLSALVWIPVLGFLLT